MAADTDQIQTPDHTRIQIVAVAQAIIAVAVAFGVPISDKQSLALVALAGVIGAALVAADASIRRERARNADKLRPQADATQSAPADGRHTTTSVPVRHSAEDGAANYADLVELLGALEKIRAALQPATTATPGTNGAPARAVAHE